MLQFHPQSSMLELPLHHTDRGCLGRWADPRLRFKYQPGAVLPHHRVDRPAVVALPVNERSMDDFLTAASTVRLCRWMPASVQRLIAPDPL
jgi:hypothetical protein